MAASRIPEKIIDEAEETISVFNEMHDISFGFYTRGQFLYLSHFNKNGELPICRLKFIPKTQSWKFVLYNIEIQKYDPNNWFYPGREEQDGTFEGALRAALKIYNSYQPPKIGWKGCLLIIVFTPFLILWWLWRKIRGR